MTVQPDYPKTEPSFSPQTKASAGISGTSSSGNGGVSQLSRKFVARRISEGETGRLKEELKCQACGKGYKHVSSLAKHLWEHTPEWNVTSKLLISKHQQVQLLEAASILVSMNEEDEENYQADDQAVTSPDGSTSSGELVNPVEHDGRLQESGTQEPNFSKSDSQDLTVHKNCAHEAGSEQVSSRAIPIASRKHQSIKEELTPARDIPILSNNSKPIAKTPSRFSHRRLSHSSFSGTPTFGSNPLSSSVGGSISSSLGGPGSLETHLRQASPLPEHVLHRKRRPSTLFASNGARDLEQDEDDETDGLQDVPDVPIHSQTPHTPKHSPPPRKVSPKKDDVFRFEV